MDQIWKVRDSTPYPPPQTIEHWCLCFSFSFHPYLGVLLSKRFYVPGTYNILTLYSLQLSFNVSINIFFLKLTRKKSKLNTNQLLFQKIMALLTAITRYTKAFFTMMSNTPITNLSSILSWQNNNTQMIKSFLKIY